MENHAPAPITPLDERTQRLRALADRFLLALEAIETPKDHAGLARAARALLTLDRLIKALYAPCKTAAGPDDALAAALLPLTEAVSTPETASAPLNRQARRRYEAERRKAA